MSGDVLPDVLTSGLRVVFCGTQAGAVSARRGAYYAGPGNKFWKTLFETGLIPEPLGPSDFAGLPRYGIGFTDVAKGTSGPDTALMRHHFDSAGFLAKLRECAPAIVAFNGKRAAQAVLEEERGRRLAYGLQPSLLVGSRVFILPSTSGAASGYWSIEPWRELAALVKETSF
ncbi:G/U mismatch-specific uracil-DNA glycosylase [Bosea lupini]|uniref:G/U mismatch-specific uracil-DNA glycosylase n=1 Tax=Bosea lupini TaxID=1036779 RepID=A0A1H7MAC1_9HYPH|nr:mismatch-specific DNA-glycosylase [Bosea lupini]SEL08280.1 G/U mismatch-specific uracil-DNA glycosylase [Bosea lupini]